MNSTALVKYEVKSLYVIDFFGGAMHKAFSFVHEAHDTCTNKGSLCVVSPTIYG